MYYPVSFGLPITCPHFKISTQYDKLGNKYDCIMYYNEVFKGELRAKFYPNFFFIYRFVYAYYNVMQNFNTFGKGFRKL